MVVKISDWTAIVATCKERNRSVVAVKIEALDALLTSYGKALYELSALRQRYSQVAGKKAPLTVREAKAMSEYEHPEYWESGYVDDNGEAHYFDQTDDYEVAIGFVVNQFYMDKEAGMGTPHQRRYVDNTIGAAYSGDEVEVTLDKRTYFVRPFASDES